MHLKINFCPQPTDRMFDVLWMHSVFHCGDKTMCWYRCEEKQIKNRNPKKWNKNNELEVWSEHHQLDPTTTMPRDDTKERTKIKTAVRGAKAKRSGEKKLTKAETSFFFAIWWCVYKLNSWMGLMCSWTFTFRLMWLKFRVDCLPLVWVQLHARVSCFLF